MNRAVEEIVKIVLASASPRRLALLQAAGFDVVVRAADVDETPLPDEPPQDLVIRLARAKAAAVVAAVVADPRSDAGAPVVAADTTVALGPRVLNKPVDDDDARVMLRALSGQSHTVWTGWCVAGANAAAVTDVTATTVTFRTLTDDDIEAYLRTGEHRDKAGSYGIQGAAAVLVARVEGSLTNVIGLPVDEVVTVLRRLR